MEHLHRIKACSKGMCAAPSCLYFLKKHVITSTYSIDDFFFLFFFLLQNMGIHLPCGRMTTVLTSSKVEGSWLEVGRRLELAEEAGEIYKALLPRLVGKCRTQLSGYNFEEIKN